MTFNHATVIGIVKNVLSNLPIIGVLFDTPKKAFKHTFQDLIFLWIVSVLPIAIFMLHSLYFAPSESALKFSYFGSEGGNTWLISFLEFHLRPFEIMVFVFAYLGGAAVSFLHHHRSGKMMKGLTIYLITAAVVMGFGTYFFWLDRVDEISLTVSSYVASLVIYLLSLALYATTIFHENRIALLAKDTETRIRGDEVEFTESFRNLISTEAHK